MTMSESGERRCAHRRRDDALTAGLVRDEHVRTSERETSLLRVTESMVLSALREQDAAAMADMARRKAVGLLGSITDGFYAVDKQWRITYVNDRMVERFGLGRAELVGQQLWALYPAAVATDADARLHQAMVERVTVEYELFDEPWQRWFAEKAFPIGDGGLAIYTSDVTDRVVADQRLRDSDARFRALVAATTQIVWTTDASGVVVEDSPTWRAFTGQTADERVGWGWANTIHPDDHEATIVTWRDALATSKPVTAVHRLRRQDGEYRWMTMRGVPIMAESALVREWICTNTDITDLKAAETDRIRLLQQAEAAQARLADVFRHAPAFMCALRGPDHMYELVNDRYEQLVGSRDVLGRTVRDALPEVVGQGFVALLDNVYATGETLIGTGVPVVLARQPGQPPEERYLDLVYQALRDPGQAVTGIVIVGVDVTERTRAEAAVRSSEVRYRTLFEMMDEGFCVIELVFDDSGVAVDYRFMETNPAFEKHTGMIGAVGRMIRDLVPDIETHWFENFGRVAQTGEPVRFADVSEALERRWFDVYAFRLGVAGSNTVAVLFSDISTRKHAEDSLQESEQRYRVATRLVSDVVWTNSADGLMEDEQPGWADFTGQSRDEHDGYGWLKAVHPDDVQPTRDAWTHAVTAKQTFVFEHRVRRGDGEWRLCSIRADPVLADDGTIREWIGVHTDITEQKRTEATLRQFAADMSEADHRKDEFLATLAHELRNPLAPIRTGLEVMKLAGGQVAAVEQTRSMMERQLTQMVRLIDDLMDVSRISRGQLTLRTERVALAAVLQSAVEASLPLIEQMGHTLSVTEPTHTLMVDADVTRLAQVFVNLLNNAAKYSDRGGHIDLHVARDGSDVMVTVHDTGIGITADQLPRIFEMFTQVDRSLEKSQGGLGIGLTLVKRIVALHGGSVEAKSDGPGHGSTFLVRLPVVVDASPTRAAGDGEETPARSALRILIVDDNRDAADSLAMVLRIMSNDVRTAYNGKEGVDTAEAFRPDVILFDIGMPTLNGFEACRRVREQSWGRSMVLIAVTGWGQDEDRRRSRAAGFDHHMVKPVDMQALLKVLAGVRSAAR